MTRPSPAQLAAIRRQYPTVVLLFAVGEGQHEAYGEDADAVSHCCAAPPLAAPTPGATRSDIVDLTRALGTLAPEQREVVLLIALEDMSYADVSRALGIPMGTVMSRLSRGRERLRKAMEGEPATAPLRVVQ